MAAEDALLFIDANKYLDLYRTDRGKSLLAPLAEQVDHIFLPQQIVDEVERNKVAVAAEFLRQKFKELKLQTFDVPDHLFGSIADLGIGILQRMGQAVDAIKKVNEQVDALALGIIERVSRSDDEVSRALAPVFARALSHSSGELARARDRKERGNPPGKVANPIGDQLTWEQILSNFKGKRRLWIISRDSDYGRFYGGKGFLNGLLYNDLAKIAPDPEVYLFENMVEGIAHFVATTGVETQQRLTLEEANEIEKEEKALPPLIPSAEEFRLAMQQLTRPSEELRRVLGQLANPSEEIRRAMGQVVGVTPPSEELRRVLGQLANPSEEIRRAMGQVVGVTPPSEELRRVLGQLANPSEEIRRAMGQVVGVTPPSEELRQRLAGLLQPHAPNDPLLERPQKAEYEQSDGPSGSSEKDTEQEDPKK